MCFHEYLAVLKNNSSTELNLVYFAVDAYA